MISIVKGKDQKIIIKKKSSDIEFVDLSLYDNVVICLYTYSNDIKRYSRSTLDGHEPLHIIDNKTYYLWLETKNLKPGKLRMEIKVSMANPELADSMEEDVEAEVIAEIIDSKI